MSGLMTEPNSILWVSLAHSVISDRVYTRTENAAASKDSQDTSYRESLTNESLLLILRIRNPRARVIR